MKKKNITPFKTKTTISRIFPHLAFELAIAVAAVAIVVFSTGVSNTATIGQEISLMNVTLSDRLDYAEETVSVQQAELEVSDDNTVETIQTIEYQTSQMCFIGDDRTVAMHNAVLTDVHFVAQEKMGLDWFNNTASMEFDEIKDEIELCVVGLGVNDMDNVNAYVERLNLFAEQYPNKLFVYVNLGPIDEAKYADISNKSLEEFNEQMLQGLNDRWKIVDLYTYLSVEGFNTPDGLHYSHQDSAKIFAWIVDSVKKQTIDVVN